MGPRRSARRNDQQSAPNDRCRVRLRSCVVNSATVVEMKLPWGGLLLVASGLFLVVMIPVAMVALPYGFWCWMSAAVGCENHSVAEYPSPDGSVKVAVFERSCGATTPFSTQASILSVSSAPPNLPGNTFSADTDHGRAPAASWGGPELGVRWLGPRRVVLEHDENARVVRAEEHVSGVDVSYSPTP